MIVRIAWFLSASRNTARCGPPRLSGLLFSSGATPWAVDGGADTIIATNS